MEDYYFYTSDTVPYNPFGASNSGNTCWWNSLMQSLLSCSSFNQFMKLNSDTIRGNFARKYIEILNALENNKNVDSNFSHELNQCFMSDLRDISTGADILRGFSRGSQDGPANGLVNVLQVLRHEEVYTYISNRYRREIVCGKCDNKTLAGPKEGDTRVHIDMYSKLRFKTREEFQKYILYRSSVVDDYKCEKCGETSNRTQCVEKLSNLREIIVLVLKWPDGGDRWFPNKLEFGSTDKTYLKYKLVANICWTGSIDSRKGGTWNSSGHYWASCLRGDGNFYQINDSSVNKPVIEEDYPEKCDYSTTHMVFYNLTAKDSSRDDE